MKLTKLIQILVLPIFFVFLFFSFSTTSYASCTVPATCDAAPGECGPTCNGGGSCVIANGWFETTCRNVTVYDSCNAFERAAAIAEKESSPYPSCGDFSSCECHDGNRARLEIDCSGDTSEWICIDSTVSECCSAGTPDNCGDGTCDAGAGETPTSCASDCGATEWCGDGSCNNGEDSGSCLSDCPVTPFCGDGSCNGSDNCSNCAADCSSCVGSFCGDFVCDAFETCSTCAGDCGACASNEAWYQVSGGHLGSENDGNLSLAVQSNITDTSDCVAPACIRSLMMEDLLSTNFTDGFALLGSGIIDTNGLISERSENTYALDTKKTRYKEKYEFFYRNSGLGISPTNDFTGIETDALKPTYNAADFVYYQSGNVTIQSPWSITSGEQYVIFIDGDLTLTDGTGSSDQLIDVANGGFIAFIVSGNIIVEESLGNVTLTDTTTNVEGVFIADGSLTVESRGEVGGGDDRFIGEGVFAGWSGVNLNRNFADGGGRSSENNDKAVELFVYRPDFLVTMPSLMQVPIRIWQETN